MVPVVHWPVTPSGDEKVPVTIARMVTEVVRSGFPTGREMRAPEFVYKQAVLASGRESR